MPINQGRRAIIFVAPALVVILILLLLQIPVVKNLWLVTTGRGFVIPDESSVFTFRVNEMNSGSGEWWLYAEDDRHFYANGGAGVLYVAFPKSELQKCPAFDPRDWTTWCDQSQLHKSP